MKKIYEQLCVYDKRSPFFIEDKDWPNRQPRTNCSCDYCFSGKDKLALIIIDLIETLEKCNEAFQLTDMIDKTPWRVCYNGKEITVYFDSVKICISSIICG